MRRSLAILFVFCFLGQFTLPHSHRVRERAYQKYDIKVSNLISGAVSFDPLRGSHFCPVCEMFSRFGNSHIAAAVDSVSKPNIDRQSIVACDQALHPTSKSFSYISRAPPSVLS